MIRFGIFVVIIFLVSSCQRRQQIINEGDYVDSDSVTVLHWKEYIVRDSFFREVTLQGKVVSKAQALNEQSFRDSSFGETDFFENGKQKATRNFERGVQKGIWKSWYEDGTNKSSSLVVGGVLREYFSYYDNGSSAVTASRQPDGTMSRTERWRNGNLKEEFLTDSLGNGRCKNYYPNGMKSDSGALFRFAPSDTWVRWDSLGNPRPDTAYSSGLSD